MVGSVVFAYQNMLTGFMADLAGGELLMEGPMQKAD